MSFNSVRRTSSGLSVPTVAIELSLSAGQSISQGDKIEWDTIRATGSHGVSVTNGEITLDTSKEYVMFTSIYIERGTRTDSYQFAYYDNTNTRLNYSAGAFDATWEHSEIGTSGVPSSSQVAPFVTLSPPSSVSVRAVVMTSTGTVTTSSRIIILEVG
jgi:hypothetical protein